MIQIKDQTNMKVVSFSWKSNEINRHYSASESTIKRNSKYKIHIIFIMVYSDRNLHRSAGRRVVSHKFHKCFTCARLVQDMMKAKFFSFNSLQSRVHVIPNSSEGSNILTRRSGIYIFINKAHVRELWLESLISYRHFLDE